MAFMVLSQLARGSGSNFNAILELVTPHHTLGRNPEERERRARKEARRAKQSGTSKQGIRANLSGAGGRGWTQLWGKSKTGFLGLKNLGCICYMNSSLQQFFMIPEFRKCLLAFECGDEDPDESMMFQLQLMFANLQDSEKAYYNPKGFCYAFKNWEGEPTDVFIQQDASEFLTMFFQHVEGHIMGSNSESLLKHSFGGEFSNELIAEGGKHSERPEPFYFISVPVKNMAHLEDSLKAFIGGETVEYTWETKGEEGEEPKKESLPTIKRISIKKLPRHLIIHLKRFEFNFETMQQAKINDRFEFGHSLDMLPFTVEGREGSDPDLEKGPEQYYKYSLCGVVVHTGTANSGHYYSFIRERGTDSWYEFNDSFVGDFNASHIEDDCFGGEETNYMGYSGQGAGTNTNAWLKEKIRNAFLLVYDRNDVFEEEKTDVPEGGMKYKAPVLPAIREEVYRDNVEFWRKKNILDKRYFDFLSSLLRREFSQNHAKMSSEVFQLACRFSLGTLVAARDSAQVLTWTELLSKLLPTFTEGAGARWILQALANDVLALKELLLWTDDSEIRKNTTFFLKNVIEHVCRSCITAGEITDREAWIVCVQFVATVMEFLPEAQIHWRRMDQYMLLLVAFAQSCDDAKKYLLNEGYLGRILSFFLGENSPYPELVTGSSSKQNPAMGDNYNRPNFAYCLKLLTLLLESSLIVHEAEDRPQSQDAPKLYTISSQEGNMLYNQSFAHKLIKEIRTPPQKAIIAPLITQLAAESKLFSTLLEKEIISQIEEEEYTDLKPSFRGVMILLGIKDSLLQWRLDSLLGKVLMAMKAQQNYIKATETSLELLLRLSKNCPAVGPWLASHRQENAWIDSWLQDKKQGKMQVSAGGKQMFKPKRFSSGGVYQGTAISSSNCPKPSAQMQPAFVQDVFRTLFAGRKNEQFFYDSDDEPTVLLGKRIEVRWMHDRYYSGTIDAFDPLTGRHNLTYDDGDKREYVLSEKVWRFIDSN